MYFDMDSMIVRKLDIYIGLVQICIIFTSKRVFFKAVLTCSMNYAHHLLLSSLIECLNKANNEI